jgi:hypothetical protein
MTRCVSDPDRGFHLCGGEGDVAQPYAGGIADGVGNGGGGRPLPRLASAQEGLARTGDDVDFDRFRGGGEAQDRIAAPVAAQDMAAIEVDRFIQGPACGLDDGALDLVADAIGTDDLAAVHRGDDTAQADAAVSCSTFKDRAIAQ